MKISTFSTLLCSVFLFSTLLFSNTYAESPSENRKAKFTEMQAIALAVNEVKVGLEAISVHNPSHKANFSACGLDFNTANQGLSWSWKLEGVVVGGKKSPHVLTWETGPCASTPLQLDYDRGALTERYITKAQTIEQQFILQGPITKEDENLVIEGKINANGAFSQVRGGWEWRNEKGAVLLGKVFVYDAKGVKIPAKMTVTADHSKIEVSGTALANATYPVTIDPEIGSNDQRVSFMGVGGLTNFTANHPSVVYNETDNVYLVTWSGEDNTSYPLADNEFEIWGQFIDGDGNLIGGPNFRISFQATDGDANFDAKTPRVAWNSNSNEYLVVWSGDRTVGENEIYGQVLDNIGNLVGGNFRISFNGPDGDVSYDASRPDVAYNLNDDTYLVVWDGVTNSVGETEIFSILLDPSGAPATAESQISDIGIPGDASFNSYEPKVVFNETENQWLVVWLGEFNFTEFEIYGQLIDNTGDQAGSDDFRISDMGPDNNLSFDATQPELTYNITHNEYFVVWRGDDNTSPLIDNEFEIFGQRISNLGVEIGLNDQRITFVGPNSNTNYSASHPGISWDSEEGQYFAVYAGDFAPGESEIYAQTVVLSGSLSGAPIRLSDMGPDNVSTFDATIPVVVYNPYFDEQMVVWRGDDNVAGLVDNEFEIFMQLFGDTAPSDSDSDGVRDRVDQCPGVPDIDFDNDGYASCIDCDDGVATTHPGAFDTPCDGIDQDCVNGDSSFIITAIPSDTAVLPFTAALITVTTDITVDSVRWFISEDTGASWFPMLDLGPYTGTSATGTNSSALSINPVHAGLSGKLYRADVFCGSKVETTPHARLALLAGPGGIASNLQLWLRGDVGVTDAGGTVTGWDDQSPNGYFAANGGSDGQTDPELGKLLNYNPVVNFDGISEGLDLGSDYIFSTGTGLSIFSALRPDDDLHGTARFFYDFGTFSGEGYGFTYASDKFGIYSAEAHGGIKNVPANDHTYNDAAVVYSGVMSFGSNQAVYLNGGPEYSSPISLTDLKLTFRLRIPHSYRRFWPRDPRSSIQRECQ